MLQESSPNLVVVKFDNAAFANDAPIRRVVVRVASDQQAIEVSHASLADRKSGNRNYFKRRCYKLPIAILIAVARIAEG